MGAKRTIARISNTEFIEPKQRKKFAKLGIDELISPESLASAEIELLLSQSAFNDTYEVENGELTMIGLSLSSTSGFVGQTVRDRKSTRLNSSHVRISYAVFCLKKKKKK